MNYHLMFWHHNDRNYPIWVLSEVDEQGNVVRQAERFWSGEVRKRSAEDENSPSLIEVPFAVDHELDAEGEMSNFVLTSEEFDRVWRYEY